MYLYLLGAACMQSSMCVWKVFGNELILSETRSGAFSDTLWWGGGWRFSLTLHWSHFSLASSSDVCQCWGIYFLHSSLFLCLCPFYKANNLLCCFVASWPCCSVLLCHYQVVLWERERERERERNRKHNKTMKADMSLFKQKLSHHR